MKEVSRKYFYKIIGPLDVCCSAFGDYPYESHFKTRGGTLVGKIVHDYTDGVKNRYPIVSKYYLNNSYGSNN